MSNIAENIWKIKCAKHGEYPTEIRLGILFVKKIHFWKEM